MENKIIMETIIKKGYMANFIGCLAVVFTAGFSLAMLICK